METPLLFEYSKIYRIFAWAGYVLFGLLALACGFLQGVAWMPVWVFFTAVCAILLLATRSQVVASEEGLVVRRFLRPDLFIQWREISALEDAGFDIWARVRAADGKKIYISHNLADYPALIETIRWMKPGLFRETKTFRLSIWFCLAVLAASLFCVAYMVYIWISGQGQVAILLGLAGGYITWNFLRKPVQLKIEAEGLRLQGLFNKRFVPLEAIQGIQLGSPASRNVQMDAVIVYLGKKKYIRLEHYTGGMARLYAVLTTWREDWLELHPPSFARR
jgi:hypothetical protein